MSLFQSGTGGSRPFEAKFPGICEKCGDGFERGDLVMYEDDELAHADPDECIVLPAVPRNAPCPTCHLVHRGDCF